jgi:hypothetical protein
MKTLRKLRIAGLTLLLIAGFAIQERVQAQPGVSISFQTFYNDLSPYGRWTNSRQYGSIWTPNVDAGFQPYSTNGYWEVTEYGNTWVSDYDWGWAPFHYGRWSYDDYSGWFWIPGYEWGPAWVNWRTGGDYYGWAPLGPGMNINVSINLPSFWWVFVPQRYITNRYWHNYCPPRARFSHIYNQTTIINNYYHSNNRSYVYGPRREEIERVTRRSVPVRQIDVSQRGRVMADRSPERGYANRSNTRSGNTYSSDRNDRYESSRRAGAANNNERGRISNDNSDNGRYSTGRAENRNERSNPSEDRSNPATRDANNGRGRGAYNGADPSRSERRGSDSENARPSAPAMAPRAERSAPATPENSRRTERSADNSNARRSGGYSAEPSQQRGSSESRGGNVQRSERSSQSNSTGNERSSGRGGRGPR